jgi:hypothetical protein
VLLARDLLSIHPKNHLPDRQVRQSDKLHHILDPHIARHLQVRIPWGEPSNMRANLIERRMTEIGASGLERTFLNNVDRLRERY